MIGFLNERSLEEYGDWVASLTLFLAAAQQLSKTGSSLFKDSRFFYQPEVIKLFNSLHLPKDTSALLRSLVFGSQYYRCWIPERISIEADAYTCADPALNLLDESLSEGAARQLARAAETVSVLSAPNSAFNNKSPLSISKTASGQRVELRNATSLETVMAWIVSQRGYYDPDSRTAPRDFQTVLAKDPARFRATGRVERGFSRRIFQETTTGHLYYVDDGHPGRSAHLEVFSAEGEHLGVGDINTGELDATSRVAGRRLRL